VLFLDYSQSSRNDLVEELDSACNLRPVNALFILSETPSLDNLGEHLNVLR